MQTKLHQKQSMRKKTALTALCLATLILTAPAVQAATAKVVRIDSSARFDEAPIHWAGEWATSNEYKTGDGVQYLGNSYICLRTHNSETGNAPANAAFWSLMVIGGEGGGIKGDTGSEGLKGRLRSKNEWLIFENH